MKPLKWRTNISGAVYVHEKGSDVSGDGTQQKPFETLRRAWESGSSRPSQIVCIGFFSEDMADGNHACVIRGDYMGAAVFDGADTYLIYGFTHLNMVIQNCAAGNSEVKVWTGSGLLAGAGRASHAGIVGYAHYVNGVAGSPVILDKTGVYYGAAGGTTAVSYNVFSRLKSNENYPIRLYVRYSGAQHNTYYGVPIAQRAKGLGGYSGIIYTSVFGAWDFFVDDTGIELNGCVVCADCKFYYNDVEIPVNGATSTERYNSLVAGMDSAGVPGANRMTFVDCIFTPLASDQVMNNPEKGDFTLNPDGPGVRAPGIYLGALPPAVNIPIMDDSSQQPGTWDENTASGCVTVLNNEICLDDQSASMQGEILSKIVSVNPSEININAFFAQFASKFKGYFASLWNDDTVGVEYSPSNILPLGFYIVKGSVVYDNQNFGNNSIVIVTVEGTTFSDAASGSTLLAIDDPNSLNVVWVRETPMPYLSIESTAGLEAGGTYLNRGNENITYRSRTIAPGESFVAENSVDTFSGSSGYTVGVMFDDSRVPSAEWIPAALWGEYFVWKSAGVIQHDADGVPISSGNYLSFQTTANGGYSDQIIKSIMNKAYFQLKIFVNKYR